MTGLARAHRLYVGFIDARARQTGHLFLGRFGAVVMDEEQCGECRTDRGANSASGLRSRRRYNNWLLQLMALQKSIA